GPRIDYLHEVVRWLDYWCRGRETGISDEAPVVLYVQRYERPVVDRLDSVGEWRAETDWPPPGAGEQTLFLGAGGTLEERAGADGEDTFEYVATLGVTAGLWSGGMP